MAVHPQSQENSTACENHYIVAGYGRVGSFVASLLLEQKQAVVVVDIDTERLAEAEAEMEQLRFVAGSADHEDVLGQAGIDRGGRHLLLSAQ